MEEWKENKTDESHAGNKHSHRSLKDFQLPGALHPSSAGRLCYPWLQQFFTANLMEPATSRGPADLGSFAELVTLKCSATTAFIGTGIAGLIVGGISPPTSTSSTKWTPTTLPRGAKAAYVRPGTARCSASPTIGPKAIGNMSVPQTGGESDRLTQCRGFASLADSIGTRSEPIHNTTLPEFQVPGIG